MFLFIFFIIEKPKRNLIKKPVKSPYNSGSQTYYKHSGSLKINAWCPIAKYVDLLILDAARSQIFLKTSKVVPIYNQN